MRRSPMPDRTEPLARGTGPARRTRLRRISRRKRSALPEWRRVRGIVWARCGGRCECCGAVLPPKGWHAHHRQLRSQGGQDTPENLLALTDTCHDRIHLQRAVSEALGHIVPSHAVPAAVAVTVHGVGVVYLDGPWYRRAAA